MDQGKLVTPAYLYTGCCMYLACAGTI